MAKGQREVLLCTVPVPRIGLGAAPGACAGPSGQGQNPLSSGSGLSPPHAGSLAGLMCQPSCLWAQKLGLNFFVEFLGGSGCLEKVLDGAKPLSSVQERTEAAVQEVSQPSLECLKCVRLRWKHLLLKTNDDVSQKRPTKHCCKEESLSRNTLLSLPETKV